MNPNAPTIPLSDSVPPAGYHRLHPDRGMEFQLNRFLQWIGPTGLDEIRAAGSRIRTYADWIEEFLGLADTARADGRPLAAAYYDRAAEFFMTTSDPRRSAARARFVTAMQELYDLRPVLVSFEEAALPAYEACPDGTPLATIVVTGGFDEYTEEIFPLLATAARAGYRMIAFDGPGQGGAIEDSHVPMTADWHRPVAAVLDHFGLDDVTLVGISLGGGLAIRAAAYEPRVRRVVALDVLDDFLECLAAQAMPHVTPLFRFLLSIRARTVINAVARGAAARKPLAAWGIEQGMRITGSPDPYSFFQAARSLSTRRISRLVTADVLLLAGAEDHYVPAHQLYRQARTLTTARSVTTRVFSTAEEAHNHCQIGNLGLALRTVLTWLESI